MVSWHTSNEAMRLAEHFFAVLVILLYTNPSPCQQYVSSMGMAHHLSWFSDKKMSNVSHLYDRYLFWQIDYLMSNKRNLIINAMRLRIFFMGPLNCFSP